MDVAVEAVARRLKLRVVLAGEGAFQSRLGAGGMAYTCMLPGDGCSVYLDADGAELVTAGGETVVTSSGWDNTEVAALMHQVDCSIWGEAHRASGLLPTAVRDLADLVAGSRDPCIGRASDAAWASGMPVDLGTRAGGFMPSRAGMKLAREVMWSEDIELCLAAEETLAASDGHPAATGFCRAESEAWSARMADGGATAGSPSP